ncbi:MAG: sorbosone dehydrogenase family protein [Alphaproteobacteria bacterium]|nr:sorbosone dehydrogenase family protein [Alphaproteobacteria bacterium]
MRLVPFLGLLLFVGAAIAADDVRTGSMAFGDWRTDAPGVRRRITVQDMPQPDADYSAHNSANVVARPADAAPKVPPGFKVELFADGLRRPRTIRVAPNGDVFVAESGGGRILVFKGGTREMSVFAQGLQRPYGIAFYPAGAAPRYVYVGESNRVVRYPYQSGDLKARGPSQPIISGIPPSGHWTRDVVATTDGRLFVAVGSSSNFAAGISANPPEGIRGYEAAHGLGAAWGDEEDRAVVRVFDAEGEQIKNYATGLRNCSGLAVQPGTNDVWCAVNERDQLGDNVPTEYATHLKQGAFYGWPWYYIGDHEEPRLAGRRPDLRGHVTLPDVLLQAHTAPLGITFYEGNQYPSEYRGSLFVAMHGSWNRTHRSGYKVVRLPMQNGKPTGIQEDFMTGFVLNDRDVWGRPVGVGVARDGSLLVSEDGNGTIWRVVWSGR